MKKDIFKYNKILKPICEKVTNHKHRRLIGWNEGVPIDEMNDYYYKCKVCGYTFFNNKPRECDVEYIKAYEKENSNLTK